MVRLGDVCDLMTGGTPSRSHKEYFEGGNIPWLVSGDIHREEIDDCEGRITEAGLKNSNARILPINSIMIALNGQGKTRATVAMLRMEATCNQSLVSIFPKNINRVLPEWIYWNLKGRYDELRRLTGDSGTDRRGLNMIIIRNIELPTPPSLEEQKQKVKRLRAAFTKIDHAVALSKRNQTDAQFLFESKLEELFTLHVDHKITTLGSVCVVKGGKRLPRGHKLTDSQTPYPYIRVADFDHRGGINIGAIRYLLATTHDKISNYIITSNDVFLSIAGSIGITGIIPNELDGANLTENACRIVPSKLIDKEFLYFFTLTKSFADQASKATRTTAQPKIALSRIRDIQLQLPNREAQIEIVHQAKLISEKCNTLGNLYSERISRLEALKQSILTQAFSESAVE